MGSLSGSLTTSSLQRSWIRSVGMTPVQWTGRTPLDLPAGGPDLIWEQEAAGSNPAIPTRSEHMSILAVSARGATRGATCYASGTWQRANAGAWARMRSTLTIGEPVGTRKTPALAWPLARCGLAGL